MFFFIFIFYFFDDKEAHDCSHMTLNEIFPIFDSLNKELSSGFYLVDNFSNCFFLYLANQKDVGARIAY